MIIAVEGNIGAGKSTLLRRLKEYGHTVVLEPIDAWAEWLNGGGDRAFFEIVVLAWYISLAKRLRRFAGSKTEICYVERSPFTAKHVFWNRAGMRGVRERVHRMAEEMLPIDIYIFLAEAPSQCYRRIKKRGQAGDTGVSLEMLKRYDEAHWEAIRRLHERGDSVLVF